MRTISLWDEPPGAVWSPDGSKWAKIVDASEFRTAGPMVGTLVLSTAAVYEHCGVSIRWSDDLCYLAVPKLFPKRPEFRILVGDTATGKAHWAPGRYPPIALMAFMGSTLTIREPDDSIRTVDLGRIDKADWT